MTIDIFTFCDFAQDNNGKMAVIGTFNMLNMANLPAIHQNLYIALKVTFTSEEAGKHIIKLALDEKETGKPLLPPFELTTDIATNEGRNMSINIPINATSVRIEHEGTYVGTVNIDDKVKQSTELYVQKRS